MYTHKHTCSQASKYSQIYARTQTAIYHYQYVARSLAVALSHIACLCISPLRCDDNNCNNNNKNNNYILIQNAHLPHFNFHTLTCTSVLYLLAYERERERRRENVENSLTLGTSSLGTTSLDTRFLSQWLLTRLHVRSFVLSFSRCYCCCLLFCSLRSVRFRS